MNFLKFVLATVLSMSLTGQAFATAPEARILEKSASSDESWQAYLGKLAEMTMEIDGQSVKGYNPETGRVFTALVMQRACYNQAEVWKQACAKPGERYKLFVVRNGWQEAFVPQAELRQQVREQGVFFPFAAPAAVAAASAPTPAPVPTPVAASALTGLTVEEVRTIANAAAGFHASGNAKAMAALNGQLSEQQKAFAKLQGQLAQAPSAAKVAELEGQLRNLGEARKRDVQALSEAEGRLDTEVAKLPDLAVSAAKSEVAAGLVGIKKEVDTKAGMAWVYGLVGAFVLLAVGVVASLLKRAPQPALVRQEPGVDQEAKMEQVAGQVFDKKIGPFDRQLKTVGGEASATSMTVQGLSDQVGDLAERVDDVEAGWQVELPADFEEKKTELSAEQPKYSPVLYLKGRGFYQVDITWLKDGWCRVDHVKDQGGNPLKIRTLGSKLKVAGRDDRLTKQVAPPGAEAPAEASDGTGFADTQPVAADPTVVRAGKRLATVSHIPNSIRRKEATAA